MVLIALYCKIELRKEVIFVVNDDKLREQLRLIINSFKVDGSSFRITLVEEALVDAGKANVVVLLDEADSALRDQLFYHDEGAMSGLYRFR